MTAENSNDEAQGGGGGGEPGEYARIKTVLRHRVARIWNCNSSWALRPSCTGCGRWV